MGQYSHVQNLRVAKPCNANWDQMKGTEGVRHCLLCNLNVHNLSAMTAEEAEKLISATEGRLCVRYYQRADGTVITKDCPVGIDKARQPIWKSLSLAAAGILSWFGLGLGQKTLAPTRPFMGDITVGTPMPQPTMGKMAVTHTTGIVARPDIKGQPIKK